MKTGILTIRLPWRGQGSQPPCGVEIILDFFNEKYEKLSLLLIEAGADIHQKSSELDISVLTLAETWELSFDSPLAQRIISETWSEKELEHALNLSKKWRGDGQWRDWIKSSQEKIILEQLPFEQYKKKNKKVF